MSKPTQKVPPSIAAYEVDLRAWKLRLAEHLELDPERVIDIDTAASLNGIPQVVTWTALDDTQPKGGGALLNLSVGAEGEVLISGELPLRSYDEAKALHAAIGDKPQMFTPEEEARLRALSDYRTHGDPYSDPPRSKVCRKCGALIGDEPSHSRWHRYADGLIYGLR
jgi:hypothetical protein